MAVTQGRVNDGRIKEERIAQERTRVEVDEKPLDDVVLTELMRMNAVASGLVTGFMVGLAIFIATNWLIIKGGIEVGKHLSLLGEYFFGYTVTFGGSLIGFAYGLGFGFALGYLVATLYNLALDFRQHVGKRL